MAKSIMLAHGFNCGGVLISKHGSSVMRPGDAGEGRNLLVEE